MRSALAATSSVAPLPAEATTSLLPIAFIGYLSCYETARNTECKLALAVPRYAITLRRKIKFSE